MSTKLAQVGTENLRRFETAAVSLRESLAMNGIQSPHPSRDVGAYFQCLLPHDQELVLKRMALFFDVCEYATGNFRSNATDQRICWYGIRMLNLVGPSDMMTKVREDDCVEVYSADGIQIFRSLNFCRVIAYSVEEIFLYPWHELYYRDEFILNQMNAVAGAVLSGSMRSSKLEIPDHICEQVLAPNRPALRVKFQHIFPLMDKTSRRISAFFVTSRVEPA